MFAIQSADAGLTRLSFEPKRKNKQVIIIPKGLGFLEIDAVLSPVFLAFMRVVFKFHTL